MARRIKNPVWTKHNCRVEWLAWNSFDSPTKRTADNCTVEYNGNTLFAIIFENGTVMNKKQKTKGFKIFAEKES